MPRHGTVTQNLMGHPRVSGYAKAAADWRKEEHEKMARMVDKAFEALDTDGNGTLSREEVKLVIKHMSDDHVMPTDEAMNQIMRAAGTTSVDGETEIRKDKLVFALRRYKSYKKNQNLVEALFNRSGPLCLATARPAHSFAGLDMRVDLFRFDGDGGGSLDREELIRLLKEIAANPDKMREARAAQ